MTDSTDPLVGSSPALDRLRELAIEAARQNHFTGFVYDEDGATRHEFNGDVDHGFKTCPHHDCTLVRELVPVPPAPSGAQPPIDERVLLDLNTRIFYAETGLRALIESAQLYRQKAMVAAPAPSAPQPEKELK